MAASFPQKIDRFIIRKIPGKGSQGIVYLAQDPDLNRYVAIKSMYMRDNVSRQDDIEPRLKEARTVSRLQHNISAQPAGDEKIRGKIPDRYHRHIAPRSFTIFPVTIKQSPLALIHIDSSSKEPIRISYDQLGLLQTLRNQAILAIINQRLLKFPGTMAAVPFCSRIALEFLQTPV